MPDGSYGAAEVGARYVAPGVVGLPVGNGVPANVGTGSAVTAVCVPGGGYDTGVFTVGDWISTTVGSAVPAGAVGRSVVTSPPHNISPVVASRDA